MLGGGWDSWLLFQHASGFRVDMINRQVADANIGLAPESAISTGRPSLIEQCCDLFLHLFIVSLAGMLPAHSTSCIDQSLAGPVLVTVKFPSRVFIVDRHGIFDSKSFHSTCHVVWILLKLELWSMNADQDEPIAHMHPVKPAHVGQCPDTVYTIERPEFEQYNLPLQSLQGQRSSIEPSLNLREFRRPVPRER